MNDDELISRRKNRTLTEYVLIEKEKDLGAMPSTSTVQSESDSKTGPRMESQIRLQSKSRNGINVNSEVGPVSGRDTGSGLKPRVKPGSILQNRLESRFRAKLGAGLEKTFVTVR
ncbi:hypothetical protein EVAR_56203_1 [Eumeta japonica]|uniref:Uncharacterized protein n=1 Tax=Eumeta variegata TaxID=151549 RepID=A0A4C1Y3D5_EUMVA|nr:hypothetical protein EVAR_56203_1 [Eumeta japonica]